MKEYNLSDTSDSVTAIIAYTIRAMNNSGFSKMQVDRYIKNIKSLSYNELVDLSNSILSSCNDYIKDLYNDANEVNKMDKKLETRIARLEKVLNNRKCVNEEKTYLKESEDKILEIQDALIDCLGDVDHLMMEDSKYLFDDLGEDCNKYLSNASSLIGKACDELSKAVDSINELPYM